MIDKFEGSYYYLSNFSEGKVKLDGVIYPTVEHAYQAAKSESTAYRDKILSDENPRWAKKVGKRVDLRDDWEAVKVGIMRDLLIQKFSHPEFRCQLLATGEEYLMEGNWWGDTFWGVCDGVGLNTLGKLLMGIRDKWKL